MNLAKSLMVLFAVVGVAAPAAGQAPPLSVPSVTSPQPATGPARRLRVYLDCVGCYSEYLRDEIDWVDFVRQAQDADIHLLSNSQGTGGGGQSNVLRFVGVGRFKGIDRELKAVTLTGDPEEIRRSAVYDAVRIGLLGYLAMDGLQPGWSLSVRPAEISEADAVPQHDPWNLWVFRVRGGGSFEAEETNRELQWETSVSADRVTAAWKLSFGASMDKRTERFDLDDDEPFEVTRGNRRVNGFVAKSFGPHWSLGVDSRVSSSDFGNTSFSARFAPAVEYSVFPYQDYASRQLLVKYEVGVEALRYNEVTIFDKVRETLWRHQTDVTFDQRQPWGSIRVGVGFSQYLSDPSKYRIESDADLNVRLLRGLSVNLNASASRIRDQLSLPRRDASQEEVLLRLRQLQSGYQMDFSINLTYSFGSLFNNVVNPRFGRRGGGGGGGFGR
jgi:hypothetical protein